MAELSHAGAAGHHRLSRISTSILVPLALAQFIASYAASSMNVAVSDVAKDLDTSVHGVQLVISLFTLVMAALMIPGSKLTDIIGRKRCFLIGLAVYGTGAVVGAFAWNITVMAIGYSVLEGVGSALMIPPIYILVTVAYPDMRSRAKSFGVVSGMAGLGAATGPLLGGLIVSAISWRASFGLQAVVVAGIMLLSLGMVEPQREEKQSRLDIGGAILSGLGLLLLVVATVMAGTYGWGKAKKDWTIGDTVLISKAGISPVWIVGAIGVLFLIAFYLYIRHRERRGKEPLISTRLFHNRRSNLGLTTQLVQWLVMQGSFFVISVYLQTVHGYSAIQTGLVFIPAIAGMLIASARAGKMASRFSQTWLIRWGFLLTVGGLGLLFLLTDQGTNILASTPGLLVMGIGLGIMLTASVNVVQSSFPESDQGEISGLSRSVSNLGSSFGTAMVGSVLVSATVGGHSYGAALVLMLVLGCVGLGAAWLLPVVPVERDPAAA